MDRFDCIIAPFEALVHIGFQQLEAILSPNRGRKFSCDSTAANGELGLGCWEEGNVFTGGGVLEEFVGCERRHSLTEQVTEDWHRLPSYPVDP